MYDQETQRSPLESCVGTYGMYNGTHIHTSYIGRYKNTIGTIHTVCTTCERTFGHVVCAQQAMIFGDIIVNPVSCSVARLATRGILVSFTTLHCTLPVAASLDS